VLATSLLCLSVGLAAEEPVVNFYNWADYIGETTIADFEAEYGIEVNYDIYDNTPVVDAKLMAGGTGYDVVMHAAANATRLIPVGIFQPLNKERLPNWQHLDANVLARFEDYDPGLRFGVPYMWGTTGFTYNVDMIRERMPDAPVDSGAMIFDPAVISGFADCGVSFLDSPEDVLPLALLHLGLNPASSDPDELKQAELMLKNVRPYLKYFSAGKMLIDLPNGEVCIAMSWSGDYATAIVRAREAGIDINLAYTMPTEGAIIWFDAAFIPVDAPHPENAHKLLNFLMRPEVIADISNFTNYANANASATPLVNPAITSDPAIYPDAEVMQRLHAGKLLPPKQQRLRTRVWSRLKTGI
jgi:putrescine transport system substrate-binding protein